MAMTITEKILARTSGNSAVKPGDIVWAEPDVILQYGWPTITDTYQQTIRDFGVERLATADKCTFFLDHMVPPTGEKEAGFHQLTRHWAKEQGVNLIEGKGIGHQVAGELALVMPGNLVFHFDVHVQTVGALGTLPLSFMGDILIPLVLGRQWVQVPETIKINLKGAFRPGVDGKDLINKIIRDFGPNGCIGSVIEFGGEGMANVSMDQRMTAMSQVIFTGAYSGIFPADAVTLAYLKGRTDKTVSPVHSDPGARFVKTVEYDLSALEPHVVAPSNPGNAKPLAECEGVAVNQGYIGSCAGGRLEDIQAAAKILRGKTIKQGFRLFVVPTSREIMVKAMECGALQALAEAGAFISSPSCDYCYGKNQSLVAGETAVSTGTLNSLGRMGSLDARIYLASGPCVAATALTGKLTDPRKYL